MSWHACVYSGLPEQLSKRFAKFIPSTVWASQIKCFSWVEMWLGQRYGARCWLKDRRAARTTGASVFCPMAPIAQPPRMPPAEKALARRLHFDQGKTPAQIAKLLQRSASTIGRLLAQKRAPRAVGRPKALSEKKVDHLVKVLNTLVDEADGCHEVTMDMLMRRGRVQVCNVCTHLLLLLLVMPWALIPGVGRLGDMGI